MNIGCNGVSHEADIESKGPRVIKMVRGKRKDIIAVIGFNLCKKFSNSKTALNNVF